MKRTLYYISLTALLTACMSQVDNTEPSIGEKDGLVTEITASTVDFSDDIHTRTSIGSNGSFSWALDDKLGFFPDIANVPSGDPEEQLFYINTVNVSSDPTRAKFTANGWGLINGKKYYSYYPHDDGNTYRSVTVDYTGQSQTSNGSMAGLAAYDYLHSSKVIPSDNSEISMEYKHIGAIVRFAFSISQECRSLSFNKLTVSSNQNLFRTSGSYNPSADYSLTGANDRGETVTFTSQHMDSSFEVSLDSGFTCDGSGNLVVNAMMSPTAWSGKSITLTLDASDGNSYTCSVTPSANLTAGTMRTLNGTIDVHRDYDFDLSATETANCYIATTPGVYRFKADVKGNGVSVGGKSTSIGTPNCAYILWETANTTTAPARGSIITNAEYKVTDGHGYIYFTRPSGNISGNALIVLMDWSPNQNGHYSVNSCWSANYHTMWLWHIWCPGEVPGDDIYTSSKTFMDRNLGALSKTSDSALSMGMLYQWGRPTPMTGATSFSDNTPAKAKLETHVDTGGQGSYPIPLAITSLPNGEGPFDINTVLSSPLQFFTGGTNGVRHWSTENQTTLWGASKTMYDPCPPGYKVPSDFSGFAADYNQVAHDKGAYVYHTDGASNKHFWPMAGLRGLTLDTSTLSNVGVSAQYWCAQARMDSGVNNYVGLSLNIRNDTGFVNNSISYAITGNPVRCQKIQ